MIPKIIHQIWVGDEPPEFIKEAMHGVKKLNPDFEYMFWGNEAIEEFHLEKEFKEATEFAFFSNVLRIKILEKFGGVYIDADVICKQPIDTWFQKYQEHDLYSVHNRDIYPDNGIIIAKPNLDYFLALVDYDLKGPIGFYWQRLRPRKLPLAEIGPDGTVLQDLQLNSWVRENQGQERKKI
jgi:mannosyltransferase OCH1-like enzyme